MDSNKEKLDSLLNKDKASKIISSELGNVFGQPGEIIGLEVKPLKTYLDSDSFSLAAFYDVNFRSIDGVISEKRIFASAHSTGNKEKDFNIGLLLSDYLVENPANLIKIPKSYSYVKSYGLFLQECIKGDLMSVWVKDNKGFDPNLAELLAKALVEFQQIKISLPNLSNEKRSNIYDLNKNIEIIGNRGGQNPILVEEKYKKIMTDFTEIEKKENKTEKVLSHGDLNPSNVILASDNKISFVDFGSISYRHHLWDVAGFCSHMDSMGSLDLETGARTEAGDLFLRSYFSVCGRDITDEDKIIISVYRDYFDLLALTHMLVWG